MNSFVTAEMSSLYPINLIDFFFIHFKTIFVSDFVNDWLLRKNLHQEVWDKLDDNEDYVRQAAIKTLGILMANQNLLRDLMKKKNLKEVRS